MSVEHHNNRKLSRISAMLLALLMTASFALFPAFAEGEGGPGVAAQTEASGESGASGQQGAGQVSVKVSLDGKPAAGKEVTLRQEKEIMYTLSPGPGEGEYSASETVDDGIYNIVIDGRDSGRTIRVEENKGTSKVTMFTVTFLKTKGGDEVEKKEVFLGDTVEMPNLDGQKFLGWMTEEDQEYDFTDEVDKTMTLSGKWESLDNEVECELEHVTLEGAEDVEFGEAFDGVLVPEEGFELPEEIEVFTGEEKITDFTYDPETGELSIPEGVITGDLSIQGVTVEGDTFAVSSTIQNAVLYGSTANSLRGYSGQLHANTGYALPSQITATMGGESFSQFSYNPGNGKITVPGGIITGDLVFSGVSGAAISAGSYCVIGTIGHGSLEYSKTKVTKTLEVQIRPHDGYGYPEHVIVISDGKWFDDYSYDEDTGKLRIGSGKVTTVVVSAVCPMNSTVVKELQETGNLNLN